MVTESLFTKSITHITNFVSLTNLVCGQYPEGVDDLFGSVDVGGLARHEVEEAVELHVARCVRVDDREDALEIDLSLGGKERRRKDGIEGSVFHMYAKLQMLPGGPAPRSSRAR